MTEDHKERTLYLRFTQRKQRTRDDVKSLHPKIIDVRFPRQKSARFCYVEFDNHVDAAKACKEMKEQYKKQILVKLFKDKKPFRVADHVKSEADSDSENEEPTSPSKQSEDPENVKPKIDTKSPITKEKKSLRVSGLPLLAVEEVLKNLYPKCSKVTLLKKKSNGKRVATVSFSTVEDCEEAYKSSEGVNVNGNSLEVEYSSG